MINKMVLENCKKRKRNLNCAWIHYKKPFDSVPHEWILRSLKLFKVSPRAVGFLKHKMKNWKTQLILTYESGTLMSDNINIKREIFQGLFIPTTLLYFTHTTLIGAEFFRLWIENRN